ncbi:hypothetical protein SLE2022_149440 [Rubroshorea leprosula]
MGVLSNKISRGELKPGDHIYSWRRVYLYAHHGIYVGEGKVIHFTQGGGQKIGTGTFLDRVIVSSSPPHDPGNPCPQCGDQSRLDGVISSCIDCFLAGGDLYLFEYGVSPAFFLAKVRGGTCTLASSDSPETVLHRAYYLLKEGFGVYHVSKNNCEDFAIYCKTGRIVNTNIGVGRSGQAASFQAAADAATDAAAKFVIVGLTARFGGLAARFGGPAALFGGSAIVGSSGLAAVGCVGLVAVGYGVKYCASWLNSDIGVRSDVVIAPVEELCMQYTDNVSKEN